MALADQAIEAWEARVRRDDADQANRIAGSRTETAQQAAHRLQQTLDIATSFSDWSVQVDDVMAWAVTTYDSLRFRFSWRDYAGERLELLVTHPDCGEDYPAIQLWPAEHLPIEELGAYLAGDRESEHRGCPAFQDSPAPTEDETPEPARTPDQELGDALRVWLAANPAAIVGVELDG